ncbi:hypothetical protein PC116_g5819 [Phytophthora cactorum]|uniref:Chitin-binding type-1 domain-containing protein n=2 Tax=Phytophthora cactorum TaxID=29920 RepID=A0A8T0YF13_9STRA|nr:hypothetical protein PC112_g18416 [Phytophthora cactorum]KAG2806490.1 hypothetical protein PC111_g17348 [Phytophthora cactorum]KAG2839871.1 hypothetical protein PC113_g19377 [Phytophthora cactorum]KAG2892278.1 hypothetical protein PC115_g18890 [Phytophthora cactorum]KAG2904366.1 hypothetical protein PC117_g21056 [Phytophthora cactorum]
MATAASALHVVCPKVAPNGGSCGANNGGAYCPGTQCCSQYGYCGVGSPWCDNNPNSIYNGGKCTAALLLAQEANETETEEALDVDTADQAEEVDQVQLVAQASDIVTAVLANGAVSLDMIITPRIFNKIFPDTEGSVFTYDGLLEAAQSYTEFAQTPNADINVLEVAYFLAHVAYTTDDLAYSAERDGTMYDNNKYCQSSSAYKCTSGANYYGRGPLFLRWNFNYYECGNAIGVDLYNKPDLALESPTTAWKTAFWTWFNLGIHELSTLPDAFALSTAKLVGGDECGGSSTAVAANAARVAKFKTIAKILNVKGISKLMLSCADDSLVLVAAEGDEIMTETTQIVANERLMAEETATQATYAAGYTNVAVVGVAMTAFLVLAVIKRTTRATPNIENGDYVLFE